MEEDYKCLRCSARPKYCGGDTYNWYFRCPFCGLEFQVRDEGFGYLPMRKQIMEDKYP